jgi:hypothetical protein
MSVFVCMASIPTPRNLLPRWNFDFDFSSFLTFVSSVRGPQTRFIEHGMYTYAWESAACNLKRVQGSRRAVSFSS